MLDVEELDAREDELPKTVDDDGAALLLEPAALLLVGMALVELVPALLETLVDVAPENPVLDPPEADAALLELMVADEEPTVEEVDIPPLNELPAAEEPLLPTTPELPPPVMR